MAKPKRPIAIKLPKLPKTTVVKPHVRLINGKATVVDLYLRSRKR